MSSCRGIPETNEDEISTLSLKTGNYCIEIK